MQTIRFGTDGWRAIIAKDFTTANVMRVSKATADWILKQDNNPSIVVGFDCRFGGSLFMDTAIQVFCQQGIKVYYDKHFVSTPMISLAAQKLGCTVGVIFTASHNPPSYNGYKLKSKAGGPLIQKYISEVEALIPDSYETEEHSREYWESKGLLAYEDLEAMYAEHAAAAFNLEAIANSGLVVTYDAMYGAGQSIAQRLLPQADFLHCEYNPSFYGQAPEPITKNLQPLIQYIQQTKHTDIAIATDGDADRIGVVDSKGKNIDSHHIILLLIHILHRYKGMNGKVVIAFSVSDKIKKLCAAYGLEVMVTKIGFKYICEIMTQDDVLVGGEESGGIAVKGHIPERDGLWNGLLLVEQLVASGQSLEELIEEVYAIVGKFSYDRDDLHLTEEQKQRALRRCEQGIENIGHLKVSRTENIDGWKFHLEEEETVMVRASGTEPVLRIYGEAGTPERVREIIDQMKQTLLS